MSVKHKPESLVITIRCQSASTLHRELLCGITDAMRYYCVTEEKQHDDVGILALLKLQEALMPTEYELERAFA